MKYILCFIMIFATGCFSEIDPGLVQHQTPEQAPKQGEVSLGLTFEGIQRLDVNESMNDEMTSDIFPADFEPPVVDTSQIKKLEKWLSIKETEPFSNERAILQELSVSLNCDQLQIKLVGAFDRGLKYHVQCNDITYFVEYDLKTVQIVKMIK